MKARAAFAVALAVIAVAAAALAVAFSGGGEPPPAELALFRAQLAYVSRQLLAKQAPLQRETAAVREVWPQIARGLPARASASLISQVAAANAAARSVPAPPFLEARHGLGGPAARIAADYHDFEALLQQGLSHTRQELEAIERAPDGSLASFERANSGLYIECIYDGSFDASLIGKRVIRSFERMGGARAFGQSLTAEQARQLEETFSPRTFLLKPHLWRQLLAQG